VERARRLLGDRFRAVGRVLGRVGRCLDATRRILGARGRALGTLIGTQAGRLLRGGGRAASPARRGRCRRLLPTRLRTARERRHLRVAEWPLVALDLDLGLPRTQARAKPISLRASR